MAETHIPTVHPPTSQVVGCADNFWIWSSQLGWDLTHPDTPASEPVPGRLHLQCEISNITIDPHKTALVIIDMQNYALSRQLRGSVAPSMHHAVQALLQFGIPAARRAQIQVVWLNWGLSEDDLKSLSPATMRVFGWQANTDGADYGIRLEEAQAQAQAGAGGQHVVVACGERPRTGHGGPGTPLGLLTSSDDGTSFDAGRVLMRGSWNADLHPALERAFQDGQQAVAAAVTRPDVLIYKNQNSGMSSSASSSFVDFLQSRGIRTLLFAGVNTDQCVMATLQDAHARGFDTILLRDACATDSPPYAQHSALYNCCRNWGFLSSCTALAESTGLSSDLGIDATR